MLRLEIEKMRNAIAKAKKMRPRVTVVDAANRIYSVFVLSGRYTVKFAVANGHKLGDCNCKGAQAGFICYHIAAAASLNIAVHSMREDNPTPGESSAFLARNIGWFI